MQHSPRQHGPRLGVFHLSCWILALVAFLQVMSVGVALAIRPKSTVVERVVTEYVPVAGPVVATPPASATLAKQAPIERVPEKITVKDFQPDPKVADLLARDSLSSAPIINDPKAERLVAEARDARIRSDHMQAIVKLDEALRLEPDHPAIIYEMATNFEVMGIYDKATAQYIKLRNLGPLKGGSLWSKASHKILKGIVPESREFTSLGVVRTATVVETGVGQRRGVIVPVSVSAREDFDPALIETKVHFFEKQNGEVKQVEFPENQGFKWLSQPVDWSDGEELVEVWYHIPRSDAQQQHLFGDREFHGYVAELYYDGELVDLRARPRPLINRMRNRGGNNLQNENWDPDIDPILENLQDYNLGDSLLPKLPEDRERGR